MLTGDKSFCSPCHLTRHRIQHDFLSCQSAIYDLHFLEGHQILTPQTFAAVSSTGSISFYHVQTSESDGSPVSKIIPLLIDVPLFSEQTIITYFAFLPPVGVDEFGPLIAATTNNGGVYLIRYDLSAGSIDVLGGGEPIHRHMLMGVPENAWCCTFHTDTDGTTSVCSGGDDSELVRTKITTHDSTGFQVIETSRKKIHDAGVTAILPLPSSIADGSSLLLTGSYDDHIRLYSMGIEKELGSMYLGGGVYRLKMLKWIGSKSSGERQSFLILACCMHAGTKLVEVCSDLGGETYTMTVVGTLKVPTDSGDNYCYAASAIPGVMGGKAFVSGTYVDKKLTSWRYKAEEGVEENQK